MRLTTKGRFAVTAMLDLALREHAGPVTLAGISEREHISLSYLEQLLANCAAMAWLNPPVGQAVVTPWANPQPISPSRPSSPRWMNPWMRPNAAARKIATVTTNPA